MKNKLPTLILLAILFPLGMILGFSLGDQKTEERRQTAETQAKYAPYPELQNAAIADLVNQERAKTGVAALAYNAKLEASACAKADDMISRQYWAHTAPDGTHWRKFMDDAGYRYYRAGENLAYGQESNADVVTDWVGSATHMKNIQDPSYTEQGMCVRYGDFQGGKNAVIVNHFGRSL